MTSPVASSPAVAARLTDAAARAALAFGATRVEAMSDDALLRLLTDATEARNALEVMLASASAEVSRRSARELGYQGLAQRKGHRNGTSLVQNITGQSTGDVRRSVQVGEDLLPTSEPIGGAVAAPARVEAAWLALLRDALATGRLGQAQFQAIRTGLGEPPADRYPDLDAEFLPRAWATAVERLVEEAAVVPVEALRAAARVARDRLDPIGVTLRFEERFAARSFRTWIDEHGQHHGRFVFDDDAALWVHTILSAALRPRRGPRFVPSDGGADTEGAGDEGEALDPGADERTNEQLQYDTLVAILRTGASADPMQAFGDRQPGVRIVVEGTAITPGAEGSATRVTGIGHGEDTGAALPGSVVETYLCDAGASTLTVDATGRPLDLGREQRLFSRTQRIAIAIRDGGCIWPSCTAPPSWCEYHHIDHWSEHHGRTDVDDGVPLCRNCHMRLHNQGWRITRTRDRETGADTYWLHAPPHDTGAAIVAGTGIGTGIGTGSRAAPTRLTTKSPRRFHAA